MKTDYSQLLSASHDRATAGATIGEHLDLSDIPDSFGRIFDVLEKSALVNIANQMRFDDSIDKENALRLLSEHITAMLDEYCASISQIGFDDIASTGSKPIEDLIMNRVADPSEKDIEWARVIGKCSRQAPARARAKIKAALNMDGADKE